MATKKKKISSLYPDWSQFPEELLHFISKNLDNCFDVVHARSVCTSWRSAFPFPSSLLRQSYSLPSFVKYPLESKELYTLEKVPLFLFRVRAPDGDAAEYFMGGIARDESDDHLELPSPLQCSVKVKIPGTEPTLMNILDCQIFSLGHQYRMIGCNPKDCGGVTFLPLNKEGGEFVVLLLNYTNVWLALRSAEMRWRELKELSTAACRELFTFRGRFYASFFNGDKFVIDPSSLEATPLTPHNESNFLVPCGNDELFLVKTDFPTCRVSRLDEEAGKWVEISDLGDRVLFIGGHRGNFCCSAKELPEGCGLTGNSILFTLGPRNVTFPYKYGVYNTENAEDDISCWRSSMENRVMILNKYFPVLAFQVER
ncbi:F-box-like domain superfamily [Arabidopsis thaliana x Arabidopsis arenosa]|uniref:F-box-like domain superfamily n=1 Tax=Arabidopsis thaliana x Arabidopsis arenosa TaxID=1240361 RepID=A0A8T2A4E2_9BRAS|nr:F-box-like domain superfamily [Arabidopsis thaliana x Arabidopsis arenosa]